MEKIVLDSISIKNNLVEYHYSVSSGIKKFFTTDCMFLEYEEDMTNVPTSILTIPFVNCMAGLSWLADCVLFVDEIDATYYDSFKALKVAYKELHNYPDFKGIFIPSKITRNDFCPSENALLLFGGGIDCQSSYLRNKNKVTHILNIYGWLNNINEKNSVDNADKIKTEEFASIMGTNALHVRSNFASQFNLSEIDKTLTTKLGTSYWFGFLHSMAFISIAAPIAWKKGISNLIIASSYMKDRINRHCGSFITTDSEFRFANIGTVTHDGFELNRNDKVALIVDYQKKINKPYILQVCSFNDCNCCKCEKCFRTIVDIISLGGDPKLFGFEKYSKEHWQQIIERDIALWGVKKESYYYYHFTANKMKKNYDNVSDKEFVDWFLSCDFIKMRKTALKKYYRQNFFSIIKRKLGF